MSAWVVQVLNEMEKQTDIQAVDAALKRHGAIATEVTGGVSIVARVCVLIVNKSFSKQG